MIERLVKEAIVEIKKKKDKMDNEHAEPSVLEKLLKVDENVAIVMSIDMVAAGVDTVILQSYKMIGVERLNDYFHFYRRPQLC